MNCPQKQLERGPSGGGQTSAAHHRHDQRDSGRRHQRYAARRNHPAGQRLGRAGLAGHLRRFGQLVAQGQGGGSFGGDHGRRRAAMRHTGRPAGGHRQGGQQISDGPIVRAIVGHRGCGARVCGSQKQGGKFSGNAIEYMEFIWNCLLCL